MWKIIGYPIGLTAEKLSLHFLLGFAVAWLACWLILTIFGVEDMRIRRYSFWLALSLSIAAHVLQDYFLGWF